MRVPPPSRLAVLLVLCLGASGCRPELEGASCKDDGDCPRSQACEEGVCREGKRVPRPDAGAPRDGGEAPPDAGLPGCDVGRGCTVTLGAAPAALAAGQQALLTVSVVNEDGAPVPGVAVALEAAGAGAVLSVDGGTTGASGLFTATLSSDVAGRRAVTASAAGRYARAEVTFSPGAPAAARSRLDVSAQALQVGQSALVELRLEDALGNPVPDVDVALTAVGADAVLGAATGQTNALGRFATTLSSTRAGGVQVTASAAALSFSAQVEFGPGPAASLHTRLAVPAQGVEAGQQVTLEATVRDAWGNPVPQQPVALAVTGSGNALGQALGATDDAGGFSTVFSSTRAERKGVRLEAGAALAVAEFEVVPGAPSPAHSSVAPAAAQRVAGAGTAVVVQLRDAHANPVEGAQVVLSVSGAGNTLGAVAGRTGSSGTWSTTVSSTRAEPKVLTAVSGPCTVTAGLLVVPAAAAYGQSGLEVSPPSLVAGSGAVLTVTVRDAFGNPVPGHPVSLSSTGSDNAFAQPAGTTDAAGRFATTFTSTRAETKRLTAALESGYVAAALEVAPGAPSAARSSLEVAPRAGLPDGQSPRPVQVVVRDAHGNPVPGETVSLSASGGAVAEGPAEATDAQGRAAGTVWSSTPCASTLEAEAGGVRLGQVALSFQYPDPQRSALTAPAAAPADGTPAEVQVTVVDPAGHPLPGSPVTLAFSGAAAPVPATAVAGPDGVARFTLSSTGVTSGVLSARAAGVLLDGRPWLSFGGLHPLSGTVEGLQSEGLVLSAGGLGQLPLPAGAAGFTFERGLATGTPWALVVQQQPTGGHCRVVGGQGVAGRDGPPPAVRCHARWQQVVALSGGTLALDGAGGLWAWGRNDEGQLGVGDLDDRAEPVRLGTGYAAVAAGTAHALAVKADGTLWAWGRNGSGQLGVGDLLPRASPALVGTGFAGVAAGAAHSAAVGVDGRLWAWGDNAEGQLGRGDGPGQSAPGEVGSGYAEVACGEAHAVARKLDGSVWAWGANAEGQLGLGDAARRSLPEQVASGAVAVAAGGKASAALLSDASLWTWGANGDGQLGLGDTAPRRSPAQLGTGYEAVVLGARHAVGVKEDGTAWAWGANGEGQLGLGDVSGRPAPVLLASGVRAAAAGEAHTVLLRADGTTQVAGSAARGALGLGDVTGANSPVSWGAGFTALAAGAAHSLGVGADGALWAWGDNGRGQLGLGDSVARLRPTQVGVGYVAVAAGPDWSLGLKSDGTLWAWGDNAQGQLGLGDTAPRASPVRVGSGYRDMAAGGAHALGVKQDGSLWAWGDNARGQLGLSDTAARTTPTLVTTGFRSVAAGAAHSLALAQDGAAWGFGANDEGQLGLGSTALQASPVPLGVVFGRLVAGGESSFGLTAAGTLWAWGRTDAGQSGLGSGPALRVPTEVGPGFAALAVGGNGEHVVALTTGGAVRSWGRNAAGQLGRGDGVDPAAPAEVMRGFTAVAAGQGHSLASAADGAGWAMGAGAAGQLGTGRGDRIAALVEGP